jgi:hypothetical protein
MHRVKLEKKSGRVWAVARWRSVCILHEKFKLESLCNVRLEMTLKDKDILTQLHHREYPVHTQRTSPAEAPASTRTTGVY